MAEAQVGRESGRDCKMKQHSGVGQACRSCGARPPPFVRCWHGASCRFLKSGWCKFFHPAADAGTSDEHWHPDCQQEKIHDDIYLECAEEVRVCDDVALIAEIKARLSNLETSVAVASTKLDQAAEVALEVSTTTRKHSEHIGAMDQQLHDMQAQWTAMHMELEETKTVAQNLQTTSSHQHDADIAALKAKLEAVIDLPGQHMHELRQTRAELSALSETHAANVAEQGDHMDVIYGKCRETDRVWKQTNTRVQELANDMAKLRRPAAVDATATSPIQAGHSNGEMDKLRAHIAKLTEQHRERQADYAKLWKYHDTCNDRLQELTINNKEFSQDLHKLMLSRDAFRDQINDIQDQLRQITSAVTAVPTLKKQQAEFNSALDVFARDYQDHREQLDEFLHNLVGANKGIKSNGKGWNK